MPERMRIMLETLKETGIFEAVSGVLVDKPMDELYYEEYKALYREIVGRPGLSIVYNVNIGHAAPRCIIPFGVEAEVNGEEGRILVKEEVLV